MYFGLKVLWPALRPRYIHYGYINPQSLMSMYPKVPTSGYFGVNVDGGSI